MRVLVFSLRFRLQDRKSYALWIRRRGKHEKGSEGSRIWEDSSIREETSGQIFDVCWSDSPEKDEIHSRQTAVVGEGEYV
jgi:hypothetical protein